MSRPDRATEVATERRRRNPGTLDRMFSEKLGLPPEFKEDKDHYYFWATDRGSRVYDLTHNDDYDVVTSSNPEAKDNDPCRRVVGVGEDGKPEYAQLLRKPVAFVQEDEKARDEARRLQERQLAAKPKSDDSKDADKQAGASVYVKESRINHGGYTP